MTMRTTSYSSCGSDRMSDDALPVVMLHAGGCVLY